MIEAQTMGVDAQRGDRQAAAARAGAGSELPVDRDRHSVARRAATLSEALGNLSKVVRDRKAHEGQDPRHEPWRPNPPPPSSPRFRCWSIGVLYADQPDPTSCFWSPNPLGNMILGACPVMLDAHRHGDHEENDQLRHLTRRPAMMGLRSSTTLMSQQMICSPRSAMVAVAATVFTCW
jgi:hypothetical protein